MKTLPKVDVTTSNHTISAALHVETAKHCIEQAYELQARGEQELAERYYADAMQSYHIASEHLALHADYMESLVK